MPQSVLNRSVLFIALMTCAAPIGSAVAQTPRELQRIGTRGTIAGGSIDSAAIIGESDYRLKIEIRYSNMAERLIIAAVRLTGVGKPIPLQSELRTLSGGSDQRVEVSLELPDSFKAGLELESSTLEVLVRARDRSEPAQYLYECSKRWRRSDTNPARLTDHDQAENPGLQNNEPWASSEESPVIHLRLRPMGAAVELGPEPPDRRTYPAPPKRVFMMTAEPKVVAQQSRSIGASSSGSSPRSKGAIAPLRRDHRIKAVTSPGTPRVHRVARNPAGASQARGSTRGGGGGSGSGGTTVPGRHQTLHGTKGEWMLVEDYTFGLPKEDQERGAKGPSARAFDLLTRLSVDDEQFDAASLTKLSLRVYQDINPDSGYFYYLPQRFQLAWDPTDGHAMRMLYASGDGAEAGEVAMTVRLDTSVTPHDVRVVRELLEAIGQRDSSLTFKQLVPMHSLAPPAVSLVDHLKNQFDIPAEKVAVTYVSERMDQIEVWWTTDATTKEFIQLFLVEGVGVNGEVVFNDLSAEITRLSVPLEIKLADRGMFGRLYWERDGTWFNDAPYPLELTRLYALLMMGDGEPTVFAWNVNAVIDVGIEVGWDAQDVPAWLDERAVQMWVDYVPDMSCETCDDEVLAKITAGVAAAPRPIEVRSITPFKETGAYEIRVLVRSQYFDVKSTSIQQRSIVFQGDHEEHSIGPIYIEDDELARSGQQSLFEYTLQLVMPDGTTHPGAAEPVKWVPAGGTRLLVGRVQLEQVLGSLPEPSSPPPAEEPQP